MKKKFLSKVILLTLAICLALSAFPIAMAESTQVQNTEETTAKTTGQTQEETQQETTQATQAAAMQQQIEPLAAPVIPEYTGTIDSPHPITNKYELASIGNAEFGRAYPADGNYIQTQDIVFDEADFKYGGDFYNDGKGWKPIASNIGSKRQYFSGKFDGNNYKISNIYAYDPNNSYLGLFADGSKSEIKNVNVYYDLLNGNRVYGIIYTSYKIENCHVYGKLEGVGNAYGISGYVENSKDSYFKSSSNNANLTASNTYGITSGAGSTLIYKCVNRGKQTATGFANGLVHDSKGEITNSYNTGDLSGKLVSGIVNNSYESGMIESCFNSGKLTSEYTDGTVSGIVTRIYDNVIVNQCFNFGVIDGNNRAAAIVGAMSSGNPIIKNCYNTKNILANKNSYNGYTGGLASISHSGKILNSYNAGQISGKKTGNIIAYTDYQNSNNILNNYFDIESSGIEYSHNKITTGAKNTNEMIGLNSLDKMDKLNGFDAYEPYEFGYPELKVFKYSDDPFVREMSRRSVHVGEWIDEVAVTGVTLNETNKTLKVDEAFQLTATVAPDNATNKNVTWSSSDENIATVDVNGNIIAIAKGNATITVTTVDGSHTATCNVTVEETQQGEKIFINDNDARITYKGTWNYNNNKPGSYQNDDNGSQTKNDSFEIPFHGTQIKWFGPKTPNSGKAEVYIDDVKIETVDCYNADRLYTQMLFDSGALADGQHTLKVVVTGTKNAAAKMSFVNADAFEIMETQPKDPETIINDNEMGFTNGKISYGWNSHEQAGAYNNDESFTNTAGMMFIVPFEGSQIKWHGAFNNTHGKADVYIDDVLVKTVDCYKAIREDDAVLFDSGTLANGQHSLKVVLRDDKNPSSSNNYITVDRIVYR